MINKTQEERLDYLLEEFKKDSVWYKDLEVGRNYQEKRRARPGSMEATGLSGIRFLYGRGILPDCR